MRLARLSSIAAFVVFAIGAACSDSTSPRDVACDPETTSVSATVTVGASVVFDWSPACPVALLLVEDGASDTWLISVPDDAFDSPQGNRIRPKVTYGQVPQGIIDTIAPTALVQGRTYELILWRVLPDGSTAQCQQRFGTVCLLTVKTFTR
jgi:hypothetical protein